MFGKLSFRKKILFSQIIAFIIFFAVLFPFVEKVAALVIRDSLIESTGELKESLEKATTEKELIHSLQKQQYYAFFRISLINDKDLVIYDSHLGRLLGDQFQPYYVTEHSEIEKAKKGGTGYAIATSDTFGGRFAYVAEAFHFQGKIYILRTAFPYNQIQDLTESFELGFLIFSFVVLLFFNTLIWFVFNRLIRPIREIIRAILPYQKGERLELPEITLTNVKSSTEEFLHLTNTFNMLSKKIQEQIDDLKVERNEKEAILESLGEGVVAVNEKMMVLYINFTACKMLGFVRKQILNRPLSVIGDKVHQELLQKCLELLQECQKSRSVVMDFLSYGKEQKTYIDLIAAPKAQGTGAILVLQDKTSHYRMLEVGKDFVANASHELRTPITIIKGYAETLHDMPSLNKNQIAEITEKIGRSCERMENLVSNLLILAEIENLIESRFHESDLITILENCVHTILSMYPETKIDFTKAVEKIFIKADAGLLELAFMNILENAIKYSPSPAFITMQIEIHEEEELVVVRIKDKGKGIPDEDLKHIFERFYRVDKTHSRKLGGAGLGLSIVKTIIVKHGGSIKASSVLGQGTIFTILLPLYHRSHL